MISVKILMQLLITSWLLQSHGILAKCKNSKEEVLIQSPPTLGPHIWLSVRLLKALSAPPGGDICHLLLCDLENAVSCPNTPAAVKITTALSTSTRHALINHVEHSNSPCRLRHSLLQVVCCTTLHDVMDVTWTYTRTPYRTWRWKCCSCSFN